MAFAFPVLFLVAADLTLASALSCLLYFSACFGLAGLTSFVMFYSSFRVAKKMKAKLNQKGRHVVLLASGSSAGQVLLTILDKAGFRMWAICQLPEEEGAPVQKKERSSTIEGTPVPGAEHKHQKEMQAHGKSHLKGVSGRMKKPSAMRWEEETDFGQPNAYDRRQKNHHVTPAFLLALLYVPPKLVCNCLKKRGLQLLTTLHTALMKFQD